MTLFRMPKNFITKTVKKAFAKPKKCDMIVHVLEVGKSP